MAQKVNVQLVDDVDGSAAESTVEFGLDGVSYAIDLSADNAAQLRDSLTTYLTGAAVKNGSAPNTTYRQRNQAIREWARGQGLEVSERGRIPADVVEAYENAQ